MVAMIGELVAKGNAYAAEGHVLFSVASDKDYGALSRRDRDAMIAGARVEVAPYKRDPADFVLWKPSADGVIGWDSPWGRGRPGWHIECSAMIRAHLGETIDIHGGGLDLIFPHHENEIAQSRCAHDGKPLANYWVHNGFVDMGAEKMSKSLGNVITVDRLLADGHRGETLRLALLSGHYRSPLPWTESLIAQSKATLDGLYRAAGDAEAGAVDAGVIEALADDLNTPLAMARLGAIGDAGSVKAIGAIARAADDERRRLVSGWRRRRRARRESMPAPKPRRGATLPRRTGFGMNWRARAWCSRMGQAERPGGGRERPPLHPRHPSPRRFARRTCRAGRASMARPSGGR